MSSCRVPKERVSLTGSSLGWHMECTTNPHDEDCLVRQIPPLRVQVSLELYELPEGTDVIAHASLSRPDFTAIISEMLNEPQGYQFPLEVWDLRAIADVELRQLEDILSGHLVASEKRAAGFDWNQKLEHFVSHRPDAPVARQLGHLAALAYQGNLIKLLDYQDLFARGQRLNFVPMITSQVIDRAVDIAALR